MRPHVPPRISPRRQHGRRWPEPLPIARLQQQAGTGRSHKAIINIYLPGGPSHLDMFDLKPDATSEVRGEFRPIRTNVPGMEICELFPQLAKMADKFALIRSLYDSEGRHDCYQCMTGRTFKDQNSAPPAVGLPWGPGFPGSRAPCPACRPMCP
ncbi:MAG: DUF1501 domain-containing protein [Verrucomicrobiales bacterium]